MSRTSLRPDLPDRLGFAVSQQPYTAKLDQNESPIDLPAEWKSEIARALAAEAWNRYPQPARYARAKAAFAQVVGIEPERLLLTAGGDQGIMVAFAAAAGPGRRALVLEPTYPLFAQFARLSHTPFDRVIVPPGSLPTEAQLAAPYALRCLVSPNNPTGTRLPDALVAFALDQAGLTFVDEAYVDFADGSVHGLLARDNLLIGRSLSKALLAGVRLGYCLGHPEVIAACEQLLFAPYHLNTLQLTVAERYGEVRPHVMRAVAQVRGERDLLFVALSERGLTPVPSQGNFLLFQCPDAPTAAAQLAARGVRVRDVSTLPGLSSHLRVTVGTSEESEQFLRSLAACPKL
jgi:histidinol-phosphate aminotransferase